MSVTIRHFDPADLPALRDIYHRSRCENFYWSDPATFQLADFDSATRDEPILVALVNQQVVGFISWWPPENFIHNLFVDPPFARQGIGRRLLNAGLQQMGRPATLKCVQKNAPALAFYAAQGWRVAGTGTTAEGEYSLLQLTGD